jgi:hypothetical protein
MTVKARMSEVHSKISRGFCGQTRIRKEIRNRLDFSFLSAFIPEIRGWFLNRFKLHLTLRNRCSSVQKSFKMPTYHRQLQAYATTPSTSSTKMKENVLEED